MIAGHNLHSVQVKAQCGRQDTKCICLSASAIPSLDASPHLQHSVGCQLRTDDSSRVRLTTELTCVPGQAAVTTMQRLGLPPQQSGVYFGQLLGMSDALTYTLGNSSYQVSCGATSPAICIPRCHVQH